MELGFIEIKVPVAKVLERFVDSNGVFQLAV